MERIKLNQIKCKLCGDIIFPPTCMILNSASVAVDGGHNYRRRCGNHDDYENLSIVEDDGKELPRLPPRSSKKK